MLPALPMLRILPALPILRMLPALRNPRMQKTLRMLRTLPRLFQLSIPGGKRRVILIAEGVYSLVILVLLMLTTLS
jgi:hypothetical protein